MSGQSFRGFLWELHPAADVRSLASLFVNDPAFWHNCLGRISDVSCQSNQFSSKIPCGRIGESKA